METHMTPEQIRAFNQAAVRRVAEAVGAEQNTSVLERRLRDHEGSLTMLKWCAFILFGLDILIAIGMLSLVYR